MRRAVKERWMRSSVEDRTYDEESVAEDLGGRCEGSALLKWQWAY
jgi:hypothetical protein